MPAFAATWPGLLQRAHYGAIGSFVVHAWAVVAKPGQQNHSCAERFGRLNRVPHLLLPFRMRQGDARSPHTGDRRDAQPGPFGHATGWEANAPIERSDSKSAGRIMEARL